MEGGSTGITGTPGTGSRNCPWIHSQGTGRDWNSSWASPAPPDGKPRITGNTSREWIHAGKNGNAGREWISAGITGNTRREWIHAGSTGITRREKIPARNTSDFLDHQEGMDPYWKYWEHLEGTNPCWENLGFPGSPGGNGSMLGSPGTPGKNGSLLGTPRITWNAGREWIPAGITGIPRREWIHARSTLGIHSIGRQSLIPECFPFAESIRLWWRFPNPGSRRAPTVGSLPLELWDGIHRIMENAGKALGWSSIIPWKWECGGKERKLSLEKLLWNPTGHIPEPLELSGGSRF